MKTAAHGGVSVFLDIVIPIGAAVAGFFSSPAIGGVWSIQWAIQGGGVQGANNPTGISQMNATRLAAAIVAVIEAGIGYAFWPLRKRGGMILRGLGGAIGGFFFGAALGQIPYIVSGNPPNTGALDNLFGWMTNVARGTG